MAQLFAVELPFWYAYEGESIEELISDGHEVQMLNGITFDDEVIEQAKIFAENVLDQNNVDTCNVFVIRSDTKEVVGEIFAERETNFTIDRHLQ